MENKREFVGRLFVNESKGGKKYLRGQIDGKWYVGFMTEKDGTTSFGIALDERPGKASDTKTVTKPTEKAPF